MIEEKINLLKEKLISFALLVENMINRSIESLLKRDKSLISDIMSIEYKANDFEIEIEKLCIETIAQYEPKAKYLRTIVMILKINNDLERIGDHAINIAQSSSVLIEKDHTGLLVDISKFAEESVKMLKHSVNSFIDENPSLAREVCRNDAIVDGLRDQAIRTLINFMIKDPTTVEKALHLLRITQNLERVADLSTNICEDVIYMVEGKVIKHHKEE